MANSHCLLLCFTFTTVLPSAAVCTLQRPLEASRTNLLYGNTTRTYVFLSIFNIGYYCAFVRDTDSRSYKFTTLYFNLNIMREISSFHALTISNLIFLCVLRNMKLQFQCYSIRHSILKFYCRFKEAYLKTGKITHTSLQSGSSRWSQGPPTYFNLIK